MRRFRKNMKFNFADSFTEYKPRWEQFDLFMLELSEEFPDEFSKDIYEKKSFVALMHSSTPPGIKYIFKDEVPKEIEDRIVEKLLELFPK